MAPTRSRAALYMYTPDAPSDEVKAYLDWVRTEGQVMVADLGFVPLPGK